MIEGELAHVDEIIRRFSEYSDFSKAVRDEFKTILKDSNQEQKVDLFLLHLLKLPDNGLQLCLLEECLHSTGQDALLQNITKNNKTRKGKTSLLCIKTKALVNFVNVFKILRDFFK